MGIGGDFVIKSFDDALTVRAPTHHRTSRRPSDRRKRVFSPKGFTPVAGR
ncbi:MAG: hypothetical protein K2W85_07695 [Phycisphaerales bacterium]|nr:hypothetical protein [Phycisphaerales bacterium]